MMELKKKRVVSKSVNLGSGEFCLVHKRDADDMNSSSIEKGDNLVVTARVIVHIDLRKGYLRKSSSKSTTEKNP